MYISVLCTAQKLQENFKTQLSKKISVLFRMSVDVVCLNYRICYVCTGSVINVLKKVHSIFINYYSETFFYLYPSNVLIVLSNNQILLESIFCFVFFILKIMTLKILVY